jgi:hypothetical protein
MSNHNQPYNQPVALPFPERRQEIMSFVKRHHYTRRCPGVWQVAYAIQNQGGGIQAVVVYGPPPYPSVARAFCRRAEDTGRVAWQARMVGAGITAAQLDELIRFANRDLQGRGLWWVLTLTDPRAHVIDKGLLKYLNPGYTGEVYHRNGFLYLGIAGGRGRAGWLIDGRMVHIRQGSRTLSRRNIHQLYPKARSVREVLGEAKQRWVYVLGTTSERAQRILLMRYHVRAWEPQRQPRLLARLKGGLWPICPLMPLRLLCAPPTSSRYFATYGS